MSCFSSKEICQGRQSNPLPREVNWAMLYGYLFDWEVNLLLTKMTVTNVSDVLTGVYCNVKTTCYHASTHGF